ncbi:hypothetical protein Tco_0951162 [Tanacetum coccineum]|uniref:Uncharacterized protein n=1 Tax=Tanacetum coccineum TaxID=301880 RepID=A0ABQ5DTB9_9ASTR
MRTNGKLQIATDFNPLLKKKRNTNRLKEQTLTPSVLVGENFVGTESDDKGKETLDVDKETWNKSRKALKILLVEENAGYNARNVVVEKIEKRIRVTKIKEYSRKECGKRVGTTQGNNNNEQESETKEGKFGFRSKEIKATQRIWKRCGSEIKNNTQGKNKTTVVGDTRHTRKRKSLLVDWLNRYQEKQTI